MSYTENRALLRTDKPYNRKIPEIASSSSEDWSSSYSSDSSLTHSGRYDPFHILISKLRLMRNICTECILIPSK